jgi:TPR repeat protein
MRSAKGLVWLSSTAIWALAGCGARPNAPLLPAQARLVSRSAVVRASVECAASDCTRLGQRYADGQGVTQDFAHAAALYQKGSAAGDARACSLLGVHYQWGRGVTQNLARAASLYERGCQAGDADGCADLGAFYEKGWRVPRDPARAAALYAQSCRQGSASGCMRLGRMHTNQHADASLDYARAIALSKPACDAGGSSACLTLADASKAASARAETGGLAELGLRSSSSPSEPPRDVPGIALLYGQVCNAGNVLGCTGLGALDVADRGEPDAAAPLFTRACDAGDARACTWLGMLYERGFGVAQDVPRALALLARGCDVGDAQGCTDLGAIYDAGEEAPEDALRAFMLFTRGCDGGAETACFNLGMSYLNGAGTARSAERAAERFEQGCDGGEARACTSLAQLFESGEGVARSRDRALAFYRRGCDGQDPAGCESLGNQDDLPEGLGGIAIIEAGIFRAAPHEHEAAAAPDTALGSVNILGTKYPTLVTASSTVPARLGTLFGFGWTIADGPSGQVLPVRTVVTHPRLTNPKTGKSTTVDAWDDTGQVGFPHLAGWSFEAPWELVRGTWTIQVVYRSRTLLEHEFVIVKP